jgi:hypothetical protein
LKTYKSLKSKPDNVPKHIRNKKDFKKQQVRQKETQRSNIQMGLVLVMIAVVLGAGLFVYNLDEFYLQDKKDITMSFSNNFLRRT